MILAKYIIKNVFNLKHLTFEVPIYLHLTFNLYDAQIPLKVLFYTISLFSTMDLQELSAYFLKLYVSRKQCLVVYLLYLSPN